MENIMYILLRIAALLLLLLGSLAAKRAGSYLKINMSQAESDALDAFVQELCMAAEQMFKAEDDDGSRRLGYVQGMLIDAGYDLTDALRAKIESYVYEINRGDI